MSYQQMLDDAAQIIQSALSAVQPDKAVQRSLAGKSFPGRILLVAVGKAAWQMAKAAKDCLGQRINDGIVITKHHHVPAPLDGIRCLEAGHPVPDEDSFSATSQALELVSGLTAEDTVLFLLSGGGSALFEKPAIPPNELQDITKQLLASGADIVEMNTVRKRLSLVKGGRFAQACAPAHIYSIVLSDILGDPLDMIASGPAYPDFSTCAEAQRIVEKYHLSLSPAARKALSCETPKHLENVETQITGSVRELCNATAKKCANLGYKTEILTCDMCCEAREAGSFLGSIARTHHAPDIPLAFIAGGETVVHLSGNGKGGRNQELALAAAEGIRGLADTVIFSFGSDGTDGPTDAAGGLVTGDTAAILHEQGISIPAVLAQNDAYHALQAADGLLMTGPTGTNVNDVSIVLLRPEKI